MLSDEGKRKKYDTYGPEMEEANHRRQTYRNEFEGKGILGIWIDYILKCEEVLVLCF